MSKNVFSYLKTAQSYQKAGNIDAAIADYSKAIELEPHNPKAAPTYLHRARLRKEKGLIDEALADCDKAIELDPNNPRAVPTYLERARLRKEKGLIDEALADYNKAIELDPDNPRAVPTYLKRARLRKERCLIENGNVELVLNNYKHEIKEISEGKKCSRELIDLYLSMSDLYVEYGYFSEALSICSDVENILSTEQDDFSKLSGTIKILSQKANIYNSNKSCENSTNIAIEYYEKAIFHVDKLLDISPVDKVDDAHLLAASIYINKGKFHRKHFQFEPALECYNRAEKFGNENSGLYINIGHLYRDWKKDENSYKDALYYYEKAKVSVSSWISIGNIQRDYAHFDWALDAYNAALKLVSENDPKSGGAYHGRAFLYRELGQFDKAEEDYKKAIDVNYQGKSLKAYGAFIHLGNLYKGKSRIDGLESRIDGLNRLDKSIIEYEKAIKLMGRNHPKSAAAYIRIGYAYREKAEIHYINNQSHEADDCFQYTEQAFEQAIKLNPGGPGGYGSLGLLYLDKSQNIRRDFDKIKSLFDKARELNPRRESLYVHVGELFCKDEKFSDAKNEFDKAIALAKYAGEKNVQWICLEICLKLVEVDQFDLAKGYLEPAFPGIALLKQPVSSDDTLDSQRKREWFSYIQLAKENFESKQRERQTRDRLIQNFAHTLGSSLVRQRKAIERFMRLEDYSRLPNVLSELDRVTKSLHLLSVSAREPTRLKEELAESLSDSGVTFKKILLRSLLSVIETIIVDREYHADVYNKFLDHISIHYVDEFSSMSTDFKDSLLSEWKKVAFWITEDEKNKIYEMTWQTVSEKAYRSIFMRWLSDKVFFQYEEMRSMQEAYPDSVFSWISDFFLDIKYEDNQSSYFSSIDSTGALYFSWFFTELAMNTFKYAIPGSNVIISIKTDFSYEISWSNMYHVARPVRAPGSRAGLDVLRIMAANLGGRLTKKEQDGNFTISISIPK